MNNYDLLNEMLDGDYGIRSKQFVIHVNDEKSLKILNDFLRKSYSIIRQDADFLGGIYYILINMTYDCDYFIRKFEAIPEDMWCEGPAGWFGYDGVFCADGFCGSTSHTKTEEGLALAKLLLTLNPYSNYSGNKINTLSVVFSFNDNRVRGYDQPTPKQRILAALYDIKKMQSKVEYPDLTKQLAVLPEDKIETDVLTVKNFSHDKNRSTS